MRHATETCQSEFFHRWGDLTNPHVRTLAWLLDAPDVLAPDDPQWQGRVLSLGRVDESVAAWLRALDADPAALMAHLGAHVPSRLGKYAERLMACYLARWRGLLAHGLQVRDARSMTLGEFDFLLDDGAGGAVHIEFASKFYLLAGAKGEVLDRFVGPNLADTLGRKLRKIFDQQLKLGEVAASAPVLLRPVSGAFALIKGWLFYPAEAREAAPGLAARQCCGTWHRLADLAAFAGEYFVPLPRLAWLAPYSTADATQLLTRDELCASLGQRFTCTTAGPQLVACMAPQGERWVEVQRAFIVPDGWPRF